MCVRGAFEMSVCSDLLGEGIQYEGDKRRNASNRFTRMQHEELVKSAQEDPLVFKGSGHPKTSLNLAMCTVSAAAVICARQSRQQRSRRPNRNHSYLVLLRVHSVGTTSLALSVSPSMEHCFFRSVTWDELIIVRGQAPGRVDGSGILVIETMFVKLKAQAAVHANLFIRVTLSRSDVH